MKIYGLFLQILQKIKPFLKWDGGKGQLRTEIEKYYPFEGENIIKYAKPSGDVFFNILSKYDLEQIYISDINAELIDTYCIIGDDMDELISMSEIM